MPNWNLLLRRSHLYLGMLLLPWLIMYGVSTVVFNHGVGRGHHRPSDIPWTLLWEKEQKLELPTDPDRLRELGRRILDENSLSGAFGVQRQGQRLLINVPNFRRPLRLTYEADRQKLRAEARPFSWSEMLGRLHVRVGYGNAGFLPKVWAFVVDLFCLTTLLWVATGVYLWWKLPGVRGWGFATLGAGVVTMGCLLLTV